jgi:dihydroxyacetone kinase
LAVIGKQAVRKPPAYGDDEIEMGVGIHGEPGRTRMPLRPVKELAAQTNDAATFARFDRSRAAPNSFGQIRSIKKRCDIS